MFLEKQTDAIFLFVTFGLAIGECLARAIFGAVDGVGIADHGGIASIGEADLGVRNSRDKVRRRSAVIVMGRSPLGYVRIPDQTNRVEPRLDSAHHARARL